MAPYSLRTTFIAVLVCGFGLLLRPRRMLQLHQPDPTVRARWLNLSEGHTQLSQEQVKSFVQTGRLLVVGAVPASDVEELLLPVAAKLSTPVWASLFLRHLNGRFDAVRYGAALSYGEIADFWTFGPTTRLVVPLLQELGAAGPASGTEKAVLLADAYYAVGAKSRGLHFHTDSESSYCLSPSEEPGVSFWLALDDVSEETGGGLEVCDTDHGAEGPRSFATSNCEVYSVRRGDAILFSKHAAHRSIAWNPQAPGLRRALVGRLVGEQSSLRVGHTPPGLIYTNGFDGPYLCEHGLSPGSMLSGSPCFPLLARDAPSISKAPLELSLRSPAWPLMEYMLAEGMKSLRGVRLTQSLALALTLTVELGVAHLWWHSCKRIHHGRLLAVCATGSLITHPFVWLWASVVFLRTGFLVRVVLVEALIVLVEGILLYYLILAEYSFTVFVALILSFLMNSASVLFGYILVWTVDMRGDRFSMVTSAVSWLLGMFLVLRLLGVV